jgi:hypothetical protein
MASFFSSTTLGSYTSPDSIDDLLLRVTLRRRAGPGESLIDCAPESRPADRAAALEELVASIPWQQKRFGPAELVRYAAAVLAGEGAAAKESPHREYVEEVRRRLELAGGSVDALLAVPPNGAIIYTITDNDLQMSNRNSETFVRVRSRFSPPPSPRPPTRACRRQQTPTPPPPPSLP